MILIRVKDYQEMSLKAANLIIDRVKNSSSLVLGLATGSTPIGLYEQLIEDHKNNGTSYEHVKSVNLDEYIGLGGNHPQSYRYFMDHQLFNHINIRKENTFVPNGLAHDLEEECKNYEEIIKNLGGIDIQILGIGVNGHIGFNEPGTSFQSRTHVIDLAESTLEANSRFFDSLDEVPRQAITMGIKTILESKQIILLATGAAKQEAIMKLFSGELTEEFPASILKTHPNVIVIADEEACGLLPND